MGSVEAFTSVHDEQQATEVGRPISLCDLAPSNTQVTRLPQGTEFLPALKSLLGNNSEKKLFFIDSPWMSFRWLPREYRKRYGRLDLQHLALRVAIEEAQTGSWFVAVLDAGALNRRSQNSLRVFINDKSHVKLVLTHEHDASIFSDEVHVGFRIALLVLEKKDTTDEPTRFFRVPRDLDDKDHIVNDFERLWAQGGGTTEFGLVYRGNLLPEVGFHRFPYGHRRAELMQQIEKLGTTVPLGELVEFLTAHPQQVRDESASNGSSQDLHILTGRDVVLGDFNTEQSQKRSTRIKPVKLQSGDICLPGFVSVRNTEGIPSLEVTAGLLNRKRRIAAGPNVVVLRPRADLSTEQRALLGSYLQSRWAANLLLGNDVSSRYLRLTISELKNLPVPRASEEVITSWRSLRRAQETFQGWVDDVESVMSNLFQEASLGKAKTTLLTTGERYRQKKFAGEMVDDFSYRVRSQYPFPLAYLWRKVETSDEESLEGYKTVLETAECVFCFLACLSMVNAREMQQSISHLGQLGKKLVNRGHGISMGDWLQILREVNSKRFRDNQEDASCPELLDIFQGETERSAQQLIDLRNDEAHGRGPKGARIPEKHQLARHSLETIYRSIEFLTQYELRVVDSTTHDTILKQTTYSYRALTGDHPLVPQSNGLTETPNLEAGSLYLVDRADELHLLRPYLIRRHCPECERPATFHLDRFVADSETCNLKSLEHGHSVDDRELTMAFRHVGVLPGEEN